MSDRPDFLIDQGGAEISPDSLLAHLSQQAQEQVDAKMREWFSQEHERSNDNGNE